MKHDQSSFSAVQAYSTTASSPAEAEQRIRDFVPMVQRAAWHIFGAGRAGMEIEDLIQTGMIALTECARKHAGPTEDGFAAYAKMRVRGAMFDLLRKTMPDSRTFIQRRRRYEEAVDALEREFSRTPTALEISSRIGCSEAELREIQSGRTHLTSIEDSYDESNSAFADAAADPFEALAAMDDRERLVAAMSELPERLQLVLQLFFVEEMNLTEIAEVLEVSVPRIHQLRAQALGKLKEMLEETHE